MDCDEPSHTSLSSPPRLRYFAATQRRVGNSACPEPNTAPSVRAARLGDQTCNPCRVCLRAISLVAPAAPAAPAMQGGAGRAGVIELLRMSCSIATDLPRPHRQTTLQGGRGCAGAGTPPTHPLPTPTPTHPAASRALPLPSNPRHRPAGTARCQPSSSGHPPEVRVLCQPHGPESLIAGRANRRVHPTWGCKERGISAMDSSGPSVPPRDCTASLRVRFCEHVRGGRGGREGRPQLGPKR